MNCTINFTLFGKSITIVDIPSTTDLKTISLDQLQNMLREMPSNESIGRAIAELKEAAKMLVDRTTGDILTEASEVFPESAEVPFTLEMLQDDSFIPNRTALQVYDLAYDSPYEGPIKDFILNELGDDLILDDDRFISFLSSPIESEESDLKAKGYYQKERGRIFINVSDETVKTEAGLEVLAHELMHRKLHGNLFKNAEILKGVEEDIKMVVSAAEQRPFGISPVVQDILQAINNATGILKAEEYLTYLFTSKIFQEYVRNNTSGNEFKEFMDKDGIYLDEELFNVILGKYTPPAYDDSAQRRLFDDDTPFKREGAASLTPIVTELKGYNKETWTAVSKEIRRVFNSNKKEVTDMGNAYTSYDLHYSEPIDIIEKNADSQILRLKQHDIVLVPQHLRWDGKEMSLRVEGTQKEEDTSYRPIISTFMNKEGKVMVRVPSSDDTLSRGGPSSYDISADYVHRYRSNLGTVNSTASASEVKALQKELLNIYKFDGEADAQPDVKEEAAVAEQIEAAKAIPIPGLKLHIPKGTTSTAADNAIADSYLKEMMVRSSTNPNERVKVLVPNDKASVTFALFNYTPKGEVFDQEPVQALFDGIKPKDFVRIDFQSKDSKKFTAIVSRKFGNMLEVVTSKGKKLYVKPKDLIGITYLEANHKELVTLKNEAVNKSVLYQANDLDENSKSISAVKFSDSFKKNHKIEYLETKTGEKEYYNLKGEKDSPEYKKALANRRGLTSKLKQGDLIKVIWDIKGSKETSGWYHVIGVTKNTVYFYTKNKNVQHINITNQQGSGKNRLAAIAYDNTKEGAMFKEFQDLYSEFQEIFTDPSGMSAMCSKRLREGKITSLNQRYLIKEFKNDPKDHEVVFTKAQVKEDFSKTVPGDIVKVLRKNRKGELYMQWRMVTDITNEGEVQTVGYTKPSVRTFESGKSFEDEGGYRVYTVNEDEVMAVGFNLKPNANFGITGHPEIRAEHDEFVKELKKLSAPKFIDAKETLSEGMSKMYERKPAFFGLKGGKETWATKSSYLDSTKTTSEKKEWLKEKGKEFFLSEGKFSYNQIWYPQKIKKGEINKILTPGDIITEKYTKKDGSIGYVDSIVIDVHTDGITVWKSSYNENTKSFAFTQSNIFRNYKDASKSDYPSISKIFLRKKGRGIEKAQQDMKTLLTNSIDRSVPTSNYTKSRDSREKIVALAEKLSGMYGIPIQVLTTSELVETMDPIVANASSDRGFIHNGTIYINSDIASSAEPLHEMGHIVLGILQHSNPDLYSRMMSKILEHPEYDLIAQNYLGLDPDRMNAEVFVTLFGEHYRETLQKSPYTQNWHNESNSLFSKIVNFVQKIFASVFGNNNILEISEKNFSKLSLNQMFNMFGDNLMNKKLDHVILQYTNTVSSKVEELKSKLFKENKLTTNCYK